MRRCARRRAKYQALLDDDESDALPTRWWVVIALSALCSAAVYVTVAIMSIHHQKMRLFFSSRCDEAWTVYFTNNVKDWSYVWAMTAASYEQRTEVLLDTVGSVTGIIRGNDTFVYYGVSGSGIFRVEETGRSIEQVTEFQTGPIGGLDMNLEVRDVYFASNASSDDGGGVYRIACTGGTTPERLLAISGAWDIAYDQVGAMLYVATTENDVYRYAIEGLPSPDPKQNPDGDVILPSGTLPRLRGVAVDVASQDVFFAARDGVYRISSLSNELTLLYDATAADTVTVDHSRSLLFFGDKNGLFKASMDGDTPAVEVWVSKCLDDSIAFAYVATVSVC